MSEKFQIVEVAPEDAQAQESLGTTEKFWLRHERLGQCLYKKSRSNTAGEDWSEKKTLLLHTEDRYNLGYCPQYLSHDIFPILPENPLLVKVEIDRIFNL